MRLIPWTLQSDSEHLYFRTSCLNVLIWPASPGCSLFCYPILSSCGCLGLLFLAVQSPGCQISVVLLQLSYPNSTGLSCHFRAFLSVTAVLIVLSWPEGVWCGCPVLPVISWMSWNVLLCLTSFNSCLAKMYSKDKKLRKKNITSSTIRRPGQNVTEP